MSSIGVENMSDSRRSSWPSALFCAPRVALALTLLLGACDGGEVSARREGMAQNHGAVGSQTAALNTCPRPDEGCACEDGAEPIDCYRAPSESPSGQSCGVGKRYCRDGVWGACEDVRFVELSRRRAHLAPGFQHCDLYDPDLGVMGCNPDCFIAEDTPNPWDLSTGNSDGGIYRSTNPSDAPGIYLGTDGSGTGGAVVDTDGDGFPDEVDACPTVAGELDSSGDFGCPGGNGVGIYVEAESASGAATGMLATPSLNQLPAPPLDIYFLLDTSVTLVGIELRDPIFNAHIWSRTWNLTMDEPIADLASNFSLFDSTLRAVIPNLHYGVGHFNEYQAWGRYGDPSSRARAFQHDRGISAYSVGQMQSYLNTARADSARGSGDSAAFGILDLLGALFNVWSADIQLQVRVKDWGLIWVEFQNFEFVMPESHTQALWSVATRNGLPWGGNPANAASGSCAGGGFGYPCFRPDAVPVVVLVTDDAQHNGPGGSGLGRYPYDQWNLELSRRGGGGGNINSLPGSGTFTSPRQLPAGIHNYFRRYHGNTNNGSRSVNSTPCGSNWDALDETISFTVTEAGRYRVRTQRNGFESDSWLYGNDDMGVALYGPSGNVVACAKNNGVKDWTIDLTPGTYKLRVDGGRKTGGVLGNYEARGAYIVDIGRWPPTVGYPDVRAALQNQGIRVVGLHGCSEGTFSTGSDGVLRIPPCIEQSTARSQLAELASATAGVNAISGQPIVPSVNIGAGGAATAISQLAEGIKTMIQEWEGEVIIRALDNPSTAFDERSFIHDLALRVPPGPIPVSCGPLNTANASVSCTAPVGVQFRAEVDVRVDAGAAPPGLYEFEVEVRSVADDTRLALIPVKVLIRPEVVLEPGSYWRDYDASIFDPSIPAGAPLCEIGGETGLRPDWLNLRWVADTPSNSSGGSFIEFNLKTADSSSGLGSGSDVCVRIPETAPHKSGCVRLPADGANARLDVGRALVDAGSANYRHLLRVTSTLYPTPDGQLTPFLYDMSVSYACTPFE